MSFSSMYVGTTGMKSHGERMGNIGNNLANVNTLGFKSANMHFETLMSQFTVTGALPEVGSSQIGKGVGIGAIMTDFNIGGYEPGTETTDLAIQGDGFFQVVRDDKIRYTRAGNFRFDREGYLVDPNQFRVQGKAIDDAGVAGATGDIKLDIGADGLITVPPSATSSVSLNMNIGTAMENELTADPDDPFFSLLKAWDGTATDGPLTSDEASYSTSIKVYDDAGNAHTMTVYLDPASADTNGNSTTYEFVAGFDPAADGRTGVDETTEGAGLAMTGTLTFDSGGQLIDMSAFTYDGDGDLKDLTNWTPAEFSADGLPVFAMTFKNTDATGAITTSGESSISLDLGISGTGWEDGAPATAAEVGSSNAGNLPSMATPTISSSASTAYEGTSSTLKQGQDGYGEGYLTSLNVNREGYLVGNFSNGIHKDLYQVPLYTFTNEWGLRREGSNHFSATKQSGDAVEGKSGEASFGVVSERTLETSNVDMADQFVKMISTERGFQANSKVITTSDSILQTLINIKR